MSSGIFLKRIPEIGKKILPILGNIGIICRPIWFVCRVLFNTEAVV